MKRLILMFALVTGLAATAPGGAALALDGPRAQQKPGERASPPPKRSKKAAPPRIKALRGEERPASPQRGTYLPDAARGDFIEDAERYRLRPPPRGFAWVRTADGFALVSLADGRVYDVVR